MTDRLAEITEGTIVSDNSDKYEEDIEDPEELDEASRLALQKFQKEADAISEAIKRLHDTVHKVESEYAKSLEDEISSQARALSEANISRMLDDNEKRSDAIRKRLRRIAKENKQFATEHPNKTGEVRVRVNTHQGMTKRFMTAMQEFEETQEKHRNNVRSAMERQLRAMNPQATDEEIDDAVRNGQAENVIDNSPLMANLPAEEQRRLRDGLADLKSRNNDIKKLEESIIQMHQLFVDMQILVESQGELLNQIEYNIEETKDATAAAHDELVIARNHQKSANKKKCIIILLIIVVALIIIIPLAVKFIPQWFPKTQNFVDNLPGVSPSPRPDAAETPTAVRFSVLKDDIGFSTPFRRLMQSGVPQLWVDLGCSSFLIKAHNVLVLTFASHILVSAMNFQAELEAVNGKRTSCYFGVIPDFLLAVRSANVYLTAETEVQPWADTCMLRTPKNGACRLSRNIEQVFFVGSPRSCASEDFGSLSLARCWRWYNSVRKKEVAPDISFT